jgi:hypothetical protein
LVTLIPVESFAGWFGPSNFDECILQNMKGVTSDVAAGQIVRVCRHKFPRDDDHNQKAAQGKSTSGESIKFDFDQPYTIISTPDDIVEKKNRASSGTAK